MTVNGQKCTLDRLLPKQEAAALALAKGCSRDVAARESGAKPRTIKAWLLLPAFKRRVGELRGELTERTLGILADLLTEAAAGLGDLLRDKDTPARLKLDTIRTIFETHIGLTNNAELRAEIEKMKAQVSGGNDA
jgi:hypothetical protein